MTAADDARGAADRARWAAYARRADDNARWVLINASRSADYARWAADYALWAADFARLAADFARGAADNARRVLIDARKWLEAARSDLADFPATVTQRVSCKVCRICGRHKVTGRGAGRGADGADGSPNCGPGCYGWRMASAVSAVSKATGGGAVTATGPDKRWRLR